jgi:predicted metal-dependent enzyme (double-stranded beta helix superfamily)
MASLVQEFLLSLPAAAGKPERIGELLRMANFSAQDLREYIFFREQFYTRNLIYQDAHWEVLTLCWQQGQQTPIHDHNGSQGWAYIVQGGLDESIFSLQRQEESEGLTLRKKNDASLQGGAISYIDDAMGCHRLANNAAASCVSLHIYSPVIKTCRYYSLAPVEVKEKALSYFSVAGSILPPAAPCL